MNKIQFKAIFDENISLAKSAGVEYDKNLSQNYKAVMPNGLNWLFLRLHIPQA